MAFKDTAWFSNYFNWRTQSEDEPGERTRRLRAARVAMQGSGDTTPRLRRVWRTMLRDARAGRAERSR